MAKITTIIDIGSNSMRIVVFKKTSRFGFYLIHESKSKVKISEGCYTNHGNLQKLPMQRAFDTLKSFLHISHNLKAKKIICIATSALRDAPNKKEFVNKVSKELKINIKIIDGQKEAYYGGVSALNLLSQQKTFTAIDIGGGSTEFAFIENNKIINTISLSIGTVRLNELFFNNNDLNGAKNYIIDQLRTLGTINNVVGLGGSIRALSRIILHNTNYPLDILHGFEYDVKENLNIFNEIIKAQTHKELKTLGVTKDRYDTIIAGTFIWKTILDYCKTTHVTTSCVGVREGAYLADILRTSNHAFPSNFNVSVRSLLDRFTEDKQQSAYLGNNAKKIFNSLIQIHNIPVRYRSILIIASKLQLLGTSLSFDKNEQHTFWYILNGLDYGFTHEDKVLIAIVAKFTKKSLPKKQDIKTFKTLLPDIKIIQWLNFMMTLNISLNSELSKIKYEYEVWDNVLHIKSNKDQYLVKKALHKIEMPISNFKLELILT
ncbi:Exopolyphosphatase [hydrothermal vent metagenome]|uniref:Exopolyphosphatase n=1 Tax=hydrothermal vent metagenome TaxID=652676 RepID=A0A3B1E613_9ZZZZ